MNKYRANPTIIDGIRFMSSKEAGHYSKLKLMLKAGLIRDLKLQPIFQITINDRKICKVILDFEYYETTSNKRIILDVKGYDTPLSKLKRKLCEAQWDIEIKLV